MSNPKNAPYRADVAALLEKCARDGVVYWSDMHVTYDDPGADGPKRGHSALDIYLPLPDGEEGDAPEVWYVLGNTFDYLDSRDFGEMERYRRFAVGERSFYTNKHGNQLWVDQDLTGWLVTHEDYNTWYAGVMLTRCQEALDPERYAELVAIKNENEARTFDTRELWSSELINEVLAVWAKAFCQMELRFEYVAETASTPKWVKSVLAMTRELEEEKTGKAEKPIVEMCRGRTLPEDALEGEKGERCMLKRATKRNPDGTAVCDEHAVEGAVDLEEEAA